MRRLFLPLLLGLLIFTACGGSKEDAVTLTSAEGVSISLGESINSVKEKLDDPFFYAKDGIQYVDGLMIGSKESIVTMLSITSDEWSTSEGVKIGDAKSEVLEVYSFIKESEWDDDSDLSLESNGTVVFSKEIKGGKYIVGITFADDGTVYGIHYNLIPN